MRTFVRAYRHQFPNVACISVMGGQGAPAAVAEVTRLLGHSPALDAAFTAREVEDGSCATRLSAFAAGVSSLVAAPVRAQPRTWSNQMA